MALGVGGMHMKGAEVCGVCMYHQRGLGKTLGGDPHEMLAELWGLGQGSRTGQHLPV